MDTVKSRVELTSKESRQLRYKLIAVAVFFVISIGVFGLIFFTGDFKLQDTTTYIFGGFGLFFYGIIGYMAWGIAADLFRGEKLVIKGFVTDKRRYKSSNSGGGGRSGRAGGRRGGKSSSRPKYYLFFGEEKYYVDHKHYSQVNVGQEIELHYAPKSSTSLQVVRLSEPTGESKEKESRSIKTFLEERKDQIANLPKRETVMSVTDLVLLKKCRNQLVRKNLWFTFFIGFIAIAFTVGALLWWVMSIPAFLLWLGVFGFLRGVFRTMSKFRQDEASAIKVVVLTKILDKQHFTGSGNEFRVVTEFGTYNVPRPMYEKLEGQAPVFVTVGKHSGWLIEIISREV